VNGAHCLECLEKGPDLEVSAKDVKIPIGVRISIQFTCSRCGARWQWTATKLLGGFLYEPS
jgi:hypothetical protein